MDIHSNPTQEPGTSRAIIHGGIVAVLVIGAFAPLIWLQAPLYDVGMLWEAGARMRGGGVDLYAAPTDHWNRVAAYPYPPLFAALFAPLTFLPRSWGYSTWAAIQILSVIGGFWAAIWACGNTSRRARRQATALLIVALSGAVIVHIHEGQVNLLVLLVAAGGIGLIGRDRPVAGGLLLAASAHLKLLPVVLLGVLLISRRWRASTAMVSGLILLTLFPAVWTVPQWGPVEGIKAAVELNVNYASDVVMRRALSYSPAGLGDAGIPNQSLWAVLERFFGHGDVLSHHEDAGRWTERLAPIFHQSGNWIRWLPPVIAGSMFVGALDLGRRMGRQPVGLALSSGLALLAAGIGNVLYWTHHAVIIALILAPLWIIQSSREKRAIAFSAGALAFMGTWVGALGALPVLDTLSVLGLPTFATLGVWFIGFWGAHSSSKTLDDRTISP